jgi:hypothetical protein
VSLFQNGRVKLSNASVPWDSRVSLVCQPSFLAYLEQAPEFANAQYVDIRPYASNEPSWRDKPMAYRWRNCLIVEHPNLPGKGTSSEKSFLFHQTAVGHAMDVEGSRRRSATTRSRTTPGRACRRSWAACCSRTPASS